MENVSHGLLKEFEAQKKAVSFLRNELNGTDEKIEKLFGQKRVVGSTIAEKLRRVKVLRTERDELTKKVKEKKEERLNVQQQFTEKINVFNALQKNKLHVQNTYEIKGDVNDIQRAIERIEYKIQTDVMEFSKEQKLVKRMNELRKRIGEIKIIRDAADKIRATEKEVRELKRKNDEAHHGVREYASHSQKKHEEMQLLLKEVDALREGEKKFEGEIAQLKKILLEIHGKLDTELLKLNELGTKLSVQREENQRKNKERVHHEIEERMKNIEEKLKKGGKLTTEDLLTWQIK